MYAQCELYKTGGAAYKAAYKKPALHKQSRPDIMLLGVYIFRGNAQPPFSSSFTSSLSLPRITVLLLPSREAFSASSA